MELATGARVRLIDGDLGTAEVSSNADWKFRFRPDDHERATEFVKLSDIDEVLDEPEVDQFGDPVPAGASVGVPRGRKPRVESMKAVQGWNSVKV